MTFNCEKGDASFTTPKFSMIRTKASLFPNVRLVQLFQIIPI